jgi:hypothetical protein
LFKTGNISEEGNFAIAGQSDATDVFQTMVPITGNSRSSESFYFGTIMLGFWSRRGEVPNLNIEVELVRKEIAATITRTLVEIA